LVSTLHFRHAVALGLPYVIDTAHLELPPVQALPVDAVCPEQQVHQQALICRGGQLTAVQQLD
jgi:hypothetical protein